VRPHARQRRAETRGLAANDVEVDQQDRLLVGVLREVLLDPGEVEAGFRVGVERKLRLGPELLDRGVRGIGGLGLTVERGSEGEPLPASRRPAVPS
jgi:hypothetical protein